MKPTEVLVYKLSWKEMFLYFWSITVGLMDNPAQIFMNHPAQLTMNSRSFPSTTARWEWNYIIIHWRGVVEFGWELWSAELERSHTVANFFWSWILFVLHQHTYTPGPRLMWIHLVQNSTSAKFQISPNIHLVWPIIHLVPIFALSTSWINYH